MPQAPFNIDPALTALTLGYRNEDSDLVADTVLPVIDKPYKFNYPEFNREQGFTVPDTTVGRKSYPNEVEFASTIKTAQCADYALDDFVPQQDIDLYNAMAKAPGSMTPEQLATLGTTNLLMLDRERRVAQMVFDAANHDPAHTFVVGSWASSVNYRQIMAHLDLPLVRPNKLIIGPEAWTALRTNASIVAAVAKVSNSGDDVGRVSRQQVADLFELDEVVVGRSRINLAKPGGTPNLARCWASHAAFIFVSAQQAQFDQPSYGFTAQFGTRLAGRILDQKRGIKGGVTIRVGVQQKEVISSNECSIFYPNVI